MRKLPPRTSEFIYGYRSILKNYQNYPRFIFTPKTGKGAKKKTGVSFLICTVFEWLHIEIDYFLNKVHKDKLIVGQNGLLLRKGFRR